MPTTDRRRQERVDAIRHEEAFEDWTDALFRSDPALVIRLSELQRQFRAAFADEFLDPDFRAAWDRSHLAAAAKGLNGSDLFDDDGDVLSTYRVVSTGGIARLRLERDLPPTSNPSTQRSRRAAARRRAADEADRVTADWIDLQLSRGFAGTADALLERLRSEIAVMADDPWADAEVLAALRSGIDRFDTLYHQTV